MKYKSLKNSKIKELYLKDLSGGIRSENPIDDCDAYLCESKNMIFKNNKLESRKGFDIKYTLTNNGSDVITEPLKYSGTEFSYGDKTYNVSYRIDSDDVSYYNLRTFLIEPDFTVTEAGIIQIIRIDTHDFPFIDNVIYLAGTPYKGCGLYALVRTYSYTSSDFFGKIYELSSDFTQFKRVDSDAAYEPVVYKNGRGNKFSTISDDRIKNRAEPEKPEALNLLTPAFKAYYSSDSYSTRFKLPFVNLDSGSGAYCKVYTSPDVYAEFLISGTKTESAEVSILSYNAKLHLDRENGIFYFTVNGNPFTVPAAENYEENNIEIIAYKTISGAKDRIFSSKGCVEFNSRLYFYGNSFSPNEVLCAKTKDKIYFPATCTVNVGRTGEKVTALGSVCNKLIAFKKSGVYRIKNTSGKIFTTEGDIVGNIANYYSSDQLECESIHDEIGCECPETLRQCSNRLIWLNTDKKVYTLATTTYGKENNIFEISSFIKNLFSDLNNSDILSASAVSADGYYYLLIKNKIFTLNYRNKDFGYPEKYSKTENSAGGISWYYSDFEDKDYIISSMKFFTKPAFCFTTRNKTISYLSVLEGGTDSFETVVNSSNTVTSSKIPCEFTIKALSCGNEFLNKSLKRIKMNLSSKSDVYLNIITDRFEKKIRIPAFKNESEVTLRPILPRFKKLKLKLSSDNNFSVGSILLNYTSD